jgi:hypothetical protein
MVRSSAMLARGKLATIDTHYSSQTFHRRLTTSVADKEPESAAKIIKSQAIPITLGAARRPSTSGVYSRLVNAKCQPSRTMRYGE